MKKMKTQLGVKYIFNYLQTKRGIYMISSQSKKLKIMLSILGIAFTIGTTSIITGCGDSSEKKAPPREATEETKAKYTNYGSNEKLEELGNAFNMVFSKNVYKFAYSGMSWEKPDTLLVYVNENWDLMSEDQKIGMIETAVKSWAGMCGARGIKLETDMFEVKIINQYSNRKVGKWGYVLGSRVFND